MTGRSGPAVKLVWSREDLHEIFLWQRASHDCIVKDDMRSNFAAHGTPSLCHNGPSLDERARNRQGSFKVALIKTEDSRFLIPRLLRSGPPTHERCWGLVRTPGVREVPACTRCSSILRTITAAERRSRPRLIASSPRWNVNEQSSLRY